MAQAETSAAFDDLEDSRIRLNEVTEVAFYQYYLVHRQLELNQNNTSVIQQFSNTAQSRYKANQVTQQDVLQAELELAQQERRKIELCQSEKVAAARINTLLREPPYAPLPPPPKQLDVPTVQMDRESYQRLAFEQRPDLKALAAKSRQSKPRPHSPAKIITPMSKSLDGTIPFGNRLKLKATCAVRLA